MSPFRIWRRRCNWFLLWAMLTVTSLAATGCGYRVASNNRVQLPIQTVAIEPLRNETRVFEVEQLLTRSLVQAFVESSPYRVVNDVARADAVVEGAVISLDATPVTFGQEAFGSTFQVTLYARIRVEDRKNGGVIFRNDNFIFREQYVINTDVRNFFSELNPALERIGRDFSKSVVTTIVESF